MPRAKTNRKKPGTLIESARVVFPDLWHAPRDVAEQNYHATELIRFAELETTLTLDSYPLSRNYNPYKFWRISETNQFFKDCLESARLIVGVRLKKEWHDKDPKDYAKEMLLSYDQLYAESKKPKENQEQAKIQYIVIDKIPE